MLLVNVVIYELGVHRIQTTLNFTLTGKYSFQMNIHGLASQGGGELRA